MAIPRPMSLAIPFAIGAACLLSGCKDKDLDASGDEEHAKGEACDPAAHAAANDGDDDTDPDGEYCAGDLACERVADTEEHVCAAPVEIRGLVYDAISESAIEGAHVAALDEAGSPVTDVAVTDAAGNYVLTVPAARDADGEIAGSLRWTLIADAIDYQAFPGAVRPSIPVNAQDVVVEPVTNADGEQNDDDNAPVVGVIDNASTEVALIPLGDAGGVTVSGHVGEEGDEYGGVLVVAEGGTIPAPSAIADASGNYTLFNVPTGSTTIRGYRVNLELEPEAVDVGSEDLTVDLTVRSAEHDDLARVTGSVNIVNAAGGSLTSVVLVPVSVYIETLERGPVPAGLRAPTPPDAPSISSAFEISGVPSGTYKVLAAFENDLLVRDPDESIGGTSIQEITVDFGANLAVDASFKVTQALAVESPGADAPEYVSSAPTFVWEDDSSEDGYELVVYDALGELVWEDLEIPNVTGNKTVERAYDGPALQDGMYYQFRVTSVKDGTYISRTEDLRGVFVFGTPPSGE
jgi:hypothetical protein